MRRDSNDKCGVKFEVNVHKLRNPRLVTYNIPETIAIRNIQDTLLVQIPELILKTGDISAKFQYETKRSNRNLVIEVSAQTWKILTQK